METNVQRYLEFSAHHESNSYQPLAYVGVITDNFAKSYEAVNLLSRHNIPFRIIRPTDVNAQAFDGLDIAITFAVPEKESLAAIQILLQRAASLSW